jgi:uncharacterized membrane protein YcaP (DUF421 family)
MEIDWQAMVVLDMPLLEIFLRGTAVYLGIFVLLRVVLGRRSGEISLSDMLFIALIADAAQNAMAHEYRSVPAGLLLVTTILFWNYTLDWLGFYVPALRGYLEPEPLLLVRNGRVRRENLKKELVTEDELRGHLREQGIKSLSEVREAYLESEGQFSVIKKRDSEADNQAVLAQLNEQEQRLKRLQESLDALQASLAADNKRQARR